MVALIITVFVGAAVIGLMVSAAGKLRRDHCGWDTTRSSNLWAERMAKERERNAERRAAKLAKKAGRV